MNSNDLQDAVDRTNAEVTVIYNDFLKFLDDGARHITIIEPMLKDNEEYAEREEPRSDKKEQAIRLFFLAQRSRYEEIKLIYDDISLRVKTCEKCPMDITYSFSQYRILQANEICDLIHTFLMKIGVYCEKHIEEHERRLRLSDAEYDAEGQVTSST